ARAKAMGLSRRRLLGLLAAGAGAAAAGLGQLARGRTARAAPATDLVVKPTPPEWFNDFGSNKEMRWEVMYNRGYEVPNELFFVRDHRRPDRVDGRAAPRGPGPLRPPAHGPRCHARGR